MPAAKVIILHAGGFDRGRIASRVRNALFELLGSGVYRLTAAHIDDVVAVAGVVEFGVVVAIACLGTWIAIKSKAGNRVLIFHGYSIACARAGIRMMQLIGAAANRFAGLSRQHFYIVMGRFGAAAGLRAIEFSAVQRHCVNIDLERAIQRISFQPIARICICCRPRAAFIIRRPFVTNSRIILGSDTQILNFHPSRPGFRSSIPIEFHVIHIALIIHIHDRRAVARDGLLRNGLRGEAGVALRRRAGLRAGGAGLGFGFLVGILIVIGVFQPVDDGVARIGIGRPDGVKRQRRGEGVSEGERRAALGCRPVAEGIAGAGGGGGRGGRAVALYERGRDIGAALRIVGDPVTIFNYRLQRNILALKFDLRNQRVIFIARVIPADNGLFIADGVGDVLRENRLAVRALLRDHNFATRIGEEHEVHVHKLGVDGDGKRGAADGRGDGEGKLVSTFVKPADEFLVRFRRAGIVEGFAVLENLASEFLRAIHKDIGNSSHRRLHDAEQRKAITGLRAAGDGHDGRQRVHGRAADEHDQRHQQGKTPTKLVFHKKLILPMKFR